MRKRRIWKWSSIALATSILVLAGKERTATVEKWTVLLQEEVAACAQNTFAPGIEHTEWEARIQQYWMAWKPMETGRQIVEDELTREMILEMQAKDEERMSEDLLKETQSTNVVTGKLQDVNYLLSKYYTVDSTTTVKKEQFQVEKLLGKDMKLDLKTKGPKVLVFHTHSQEAFADSKKGDPNTSIVGMGAYLTKKLNENGIPAIHDDRIYDVIDGKLDRSKAYELSEIGVKELLNQYPSIEVVIDLHRDGVREDLHLVQEVDGKQTARIMFFNGLSRTKANGDIAYLKNPYIQDNLAFSFQMQLAAEELYPGLARKIYLKGYRYSLHMMPKSLLVEAGAQTNTVAEMKNAMDCLVEILKEVLVETENGL